jgi:arylsulfatase I/J
VFQSDNGGCPKLSESGGNNWPLRGGKYSDLEGGVRTAAFVGGGYLASRGGGGRTSEIIHVADWYATIAGLAGIDAADVKDDRAAAAGLPGIDSNDQASMLFDGGPSKWQGEPLMLSSDAVMLDDYKLIQASKVSPAGHPGPLYPNASSYLSPVDDPSLNLNCSSGCLFNVVADPTEHNDLAASQPGLVQTMQAMLEDGRATAYENADVFEDDCVGVDIGDAPNCGCYQAFHKHGGYFGPYAH